MSNLAGHAFLGEKEIITAFQFLDVFTLFAMQRVIVFLNLFIYPLHFVKHIFSSHMPKHCTEASSSVLLACHWPLDALV